MSSVTLDLRGVDKMKRNLKELKKRGPKAVGAGLFGLGNEIMTDAKDRTPVDLGPLRASGYTTLPVRRGKVVIVEDGFGGPAKEYAIVQHEDIGLHHITGEAKFLESAFDEHRPRALKRLQELTKAAFARNAGPGSGDNPQDPG